jgi:aminomethyltransferase
MTSGYERLRAARAVIDLSARGRIRVTGEDRKRLLHAMTTNHIEQMQPGDCLYTFFLNAQGRVLADAVVYCFEDHLLLSVEPEVREKVQTHLDKYIIADDVTLEDVSASTGEYSIEGPEAEGDRSVTETGLPGTRRVVPAGHVPPAEVDAEDVRTVRLETGRPRYGEDITEAHIAHETGQLHAIHFSKGCYLGQEIVERVRSRGHVNRRLRHLRVEAAAPPPPGTKVLASGKEAGEITSAVFSSAWNAVAALGYLRAGTDAQELFTGEGAMGLRVSVL